jgi:hypothetical protein
MDKSGRKIVELIAYVLIFAGYALLLFGHCRAIVSG